MRNDKSQFQSLRWRLLLSYLGVMVSILGTSGSAVYRLFADSLYQQLDQHLLTVAQAAAPNLRDIKQDKTAVDREAERVLHRDGDLDISWQHLQGLNQGLEWFDSKKQRLAQSGTISIDLPLHVGSQMLPENQIRSLAIPTYSYREGEQYLEGYIRVSKSTESVEDLLIKLRWGLSLGGVVALLLSTLCGRWLAKQSLKSIESSFQQLKQFTADASYELRSPLISIKTAVEVMQTHPERLDPADVKQLGAIAKATNQMNHLIEDLLLLARIGAGTVKLTQEQVLIPLDELLEDLLDSFEPQAQQRGIALKSDVCPHVYVVGNGPLMTRLFSSLLQNALCYTSAGGTVMLSMFPIDRSVIISVEDTGIGIAPEDLPHVFDRFWRSDKAHFHWEGTGLGLAIAQSIAHGHGGEITVCSKLEIGTSFQVRLPYRKSWVLNLE